MSDKIKDKMKIKDLTKAKADIEDGKTLKQIIDENEFDVGLVSLNKQLVMKYGSDNVGNPLRELRLETNLKSIIENAVKEMPKAKVVAKVEQALANLTA